MTSGLSSLWMRIRNLLRDTARRLVETIAHPLNQPRLSPDGRKGGARLHHHPAANQCHAPKRNGSLVLTYLRRFPRDRSLHHAVSDVYQDLTGEGSYHGKGIYDLAAFHRILSGRFPEAHLLSHDLLEGSHVRVALATDIELLDVFRPVTSRGGIGNTAGSAAIGRSSIG